MALPHFSTDRLLKMTGPELDSYFDNFARYQPEAPFFSYAIRAGGKSLFSNDTMDLKRKFRRYVGGLKRRSCA